MIITFDIECVPCQDPSVKAEIAAGITAPGTYKKPESIQAWLDENREAEADKEWQKTVFDGAYGQIVCIGWAIDYQAPQSLRVTDLSLAQEASLIRDWFAVLRTHTTGTSGTRPVLVGFNHVSFDIPYIWKRACVHGIKPPFWWPRDPKPWSESVFDCMTQWSGARGAIKMDRLCKVLGIPGKDGISGADVWPMAQAGKFAEIGAYCEGDVARTRAIYDRLTFAEAA